MSLARRALLACSRSAFSTSLVLRRCVSSASHRGHEEHHDEHHDSTEYPKEGFGNAFWRNTVLLSIAVVAGYKYAPAPTDDAYLTRWIALYTAPRDYWLDMNAKHTALQQEVSETNILFSDAKLPPVHRYRYPQSFEQKSPFLTPVGSDVDMSGVVIKKD